MHYKKAPILEAVLEFRWIERKPLDQLKSIFEDPALRDFEEPKQRIHIELGAAFDGGSGSMSHQQKQVGYEAVLRDGSQIIFLEEAKYVFVQRAPYDCWEYFSARALSILQPVVSRLQIPEFTRVGLRFVNRIDIPMIAGSSINTDDYVTVRFNGPRPDGGVIEEFQMRVVKPSERPGIHYALVLATTASPLPEHQSILLDIDVFSNRPVASSGDGLMGTLSEMRAEKNDIFEACLTDQARDLFGGVEP